MNKSIVILCMTFYGALSAMTTVGIDVLFDEYPHLLRDKNVGVVTNHTAINRSLQSTIELMKTHEKPLEFRLVALFGPEHGINGLEHADDLVTDKKDATGIPIYSLHGVRRRPSDKMLKGIDTIVCDIQDIGSRSYTYISTLFYVMEEAAKHDIHVIVTDRPNPINGLMVDGPMLDDAWRSFVGYVNIPYCHGMTIGELALFFNEEYDIGCKLTVIPMKSWNRSMDFEDTGLTWVPTSPHIPESDTPLYYPITGILGELQIVSIGIGYTLPFKLVGAPWINADLYAKHLNAQKYPGIHFQPFHFKPFYGRFRGEDCHGVRIVVTDTSKYKPVSTQYLLIGMLKSLYPARFKEAIEAVQHRKEMFCKINGTEDVYNIMTTEKYISWKLRGLHATRREVFMLIRKKYMLPQYSVL